MNIFNQSESLPLIGQNESSRDPLPYYVLTNIEVIIAFIIMTCCFTLLFQFDRKMAFQFWDPGQILAILIVIAVILISAFIYLRWTIVWDDSKTDLTNKTAIVTGANVG